MGRQIYAAVQWFLFLLLLLVIFIGYIKIGKLKLSVKQKILLYLHEATEFVKTAHEKKDPMQMNKAYNKLYKIVDETKFSENELGFSEKTNPEAALRKLGFYVKNQILPKLRIEYLNKEHFEYLNYNLKTILADVYNDKPAQLIEFINSNIIEKSEDKTTWVKALQSKVRAKFKKFASMKYQISLVFIYAVIIIIIKMFFPTTSIYNLVLRSSTIIGSIWLIIQIGNFIENKKLDKKDK